MGPVVDLPAERILDPDAPHFSVSQDPTSDPYLDVHHEWSAWDTWILLGGAIDTDLIDLPMPEYPVRESQEVMRRSRMLPVLSPWILRSQMSPVPVLLSMSSIHKALAKQDAGLGPWSSATMPRRYAKNNGPRNLRHRYRCPPGCWPAKEASRLDDLPWHTRVTLTAPDWVTFGRWWGHTQILDRLDALSRRLGSQAFYVCSIAIGPRSGKIHAHLVIGGSTRDRVHEICNRWPGRYKFQPCDNPWKAVHYCLAQTEIPGIAGETKAEYWYRVRVAHDDDDCSYCDGNLQPPVTSANLDLLVELRRRQIRRSRSRVTPERRQEIARLGGLAKAARAREKVAPRGLTRARIGPG